MGLRLVKGANLDSDPGYPEFSGRSSRNRSGHIAEMAAAVLGISRRKLLLIGILGISCLGSTMAALILISDSTKKDAEATEVAPVAMPVQEVVAPSTLDILVPVRDIKKGEQLIPALFVRVKRPASTVADNTLVDLAQIQGKFATTTIPAYFPVISEFVTSDRPNNQLREKIPYGFRAVAINVNATSSVEGWAKAGAVVDIQWVGSLDGELIGRIIAENVKVISVERKTAEQGEERNKQPATHIPATVSLLATESDAQKISLAASSGQLILHLRGKTDTGKITYSRRVLTLKDLWSGVAQGQFDQVDGYVRAQTESGDQREWVIIDGKLVEKTF